MILDSVNRKLCALHWLLLVTLFATSVTQVAAQNDNYGAAKANQRNLPTGDQLGGRTDFDYLSMKDHPSRSGVPLGGIGAGNVQFAPNGRFVRIGMNNIHVPIRESTASFFAVRTKSRKGIHVQRIVKDNDEQYGIAGTQHTTYRGLFPIAILDAGKTGAVKTKIGAWSSLIPHDIKHSSLPVVFFEVELEGDEDAEVSVALSWEDFISRGIRDPNSVDGMDGQVLARSELLNGEEWPFMQTVTTFARSFSIGGYAGVRQFCPTPLTPRKATFQNYVDEVVVLTQQSPDVAISTVVSYDYDHGNQAWDQFWQQGQFAPLQNDSIQLSIPDQRNGASIACATTKIRKGEKKVIRFLLCWFCPELKIDMDNGVAGSFWAGGSGYGKYFHNYFENISELTNYAIAQRGMLEQKTREWQEPILESTLPDWYKFKLINSAYVIYTNMILNRKGDMTVNEGGMGGLAGTMDQRISSHPFYQKFFTQLDRSEMCIFGDAQAFDGSINHFIGHYYVGMGTVGGRVPTENHWMVDNTEGWIIQIAKDYEQTGDIAYVKRFAGRIKDGMKFLKSKMPEGVEIPVGPTTYDDFPHPPIYSYGAGMYLAGLRAAKVIAMAVGDSTWARELDEQFLRTQKDAIRMLWNGKFFAYGCEIDGTKRRDSILFTGQLAGQFISRYCGWGDIYPQQIIEASLLSQFKISLSATPDYYANKVWDISLGKGIDQRGSQCWPFYLESYTAYPALETGYIDDGMDIMKHIQLVHLRKGLTWSQNLWNPGEITYMTAPVTWFSTDVLAGAGVNVNTGELRLAPLNLKQVVSVYPLYYPKFWATVRVDHTKRKVVLKVSKHFGEPVIFHRLKIQQAGKSSMDERLFTFGEFKAQSGSELDLSRYYNELTTQQIATAVLPDPGSTPFKIFKPF